MQRFTVRCARGKYSQEIRSMRFQRCDACQVPPFIAPRAKCLSHLLYLTQTHTRMFPADAPEFGLTGRDRLPNGSRRATGVTHRCANSEAGRTVRLKVVYK